MTKNVTRPNRWIFWLELLLAAFIPFIIWWSITPTNILNSNSLFKLLETIGLRGSTLIFFTGVPIGVIGLRKAKGMEKRRTATIVLSILNLSMASIEIALMFLIFCMVVFGGASV